MEGWRQFKLGPTKIAFGSRQENGVLFPFARRNSISQAAVAVKAQDELAMLGLDGGPRPPNNSTIRQKGNKTPRICTNHGQNT
jgi:hypothetical protein